MRTAFAPASPAEAELGLDAPQTSPSVLIVHSSSDAYGSDRACHEIALALRLAGYQVHVLIPSPGPLATIFRQHGIEFTTLDPLVIRRADLRGRELPRTLAAWPIRWAKLRSFASRSRYDLVYSNCSVTLGGAYLARRWKAPHLWHVHEFLPSGIAGKGIAWLLSRADVVLVCSASVGDQFRSQRLRRICRVAYTGSRPSEVPRGSRRPFDTPIVELVCVGRLNGWKGQATLIHAVHLLRNRGMQVRLQLIGDVFGNQHSFREALERQIEKLGLGEHVCLRGFQVRVHEVMAQADAIVVPSERPEPFGMVLIEAMGLGRPVIATNAGGPSEIVEHGVNGLLVPAGSAFAIADAVEDLARDPVRARAIGECGRLRAAEFTPDRMTQIVLQACSVLLRNHRGLHKTSRLARVRGAHRPSPPSSRSLS